MIGFRAAAGYFSRGTYTGAFIFGAGATPAGLGESQESRVPANSNLQQDPFSSRLIVGICVSRDISFGRSGAWKCAHPADILGGDVSAVIVWRAGEGRLIFHVIKAE